MTADSGGRCGRLLKKAAGVAKDRRAPNAPREGRADVAVLAARSGRGRLSHNVLSAVSKGSGIGLLACLSGACGPRKAMKTGFGTIVCFQWLGPGFQPCPGPFSAA